MDAASVIAGWKQRLVALAETPEFVIRDTPRHLIEQHHQRLMTFAGYTESEVAGAETRLGVQFPAVFREYLREMGKSPGDLFCGSDLAGITEFEQFRAYALKLLAETDPTLTLPPEAVVFLLHQGYTFVYLLAAGGLDRPPMQWTENEREPRQVADSLVEMVDAELQLMESNNADFREDGGYYLTLHPEGGSTQSHPARASGKRPLDQMRPRKPWWRFW